MSDSSAFGFGKFIPGFDFLQNLTKGGAAMPQMSHWIAPTVSVEDLEKRITELKAVQFWLEQNSRALAATVQALEVQKMTLATLKGMNLNVGDIAKAFTVDPMAAMESLRQATQAATGAATRQPAAAPEPKAKEAPAAAAPEADSSAGAQAKPASLIDPLQWWGALTQQFQSIAQQTLSDAGTREALERTRAMATDVAQDAFKTAAEIAGKMTAQGLEQFQQAAQAAARTATAAAAATPKAAKAAKAGKVVKPEEPSEAAPEPAVRPRSPRSSTAAKKTEGAAAPRKRAKAVEPDPKAQPASRQRAASRR